jgi:hypothetical protein
MGKSNEAHRLTGLVFDEEDIEVIGRSFNVFLKNANAYGALLVDKHGHFVTKEGEA